MPTADRPRFVPEAIRLFLAQDYPKKELVVLDDGLENVSDLIPVHPQIRYLRLDRRHSIGNKRNFACDAASGGIIAHWDDDDWYAPWRLSYQVAEILHGADICGLARVLFFEPKAQRAWEYVYPKTGRPWVYGATFCYRKWIWQRNPFPDVTGPDDTIFIANLPAARVFTLPRTEMYVGLIHGANGSPKRTADPLWRPQPIERITRVVHGNWAQMPRRPASKAGSKPVAAFSASLGAATVVSGVFAVAVTPTYANPKGGQVTAGSATITQTSPSRLDIVQPTDRAAIDWQSFSIAPNEQTNFHQPAPTSMTLNRVAPGDPSVIAGRLTANGQVVLVNPSGITFSKGAVVDVNSLVATPTDISNANFMAGKMKFDKPSTDPRASVVNQGTITVAQKGLAALVGTGAANSGTIHAKLGKVVLGGAQTYAIDFYGDGLISFDVGSKVTAVPTGSDGQPMKSLVSNTGRIDAPGGTVLLTADAAAGIVESVVNVSGRITAKTSGQTPGLVTIDAGPGGAANLSGKINVSGLKPGQTGGSATVTGASVNLANTAYIGARGSAGGGTVRIGGGPHGKDLTVRNAQTTTVAAAAVIDAGATRSGNGGQVTVWSDQTTTFAGTIKARGGTSGGDGGWVETSGKGSLSVAPTAVIDASSPEGKPGEWLLDPPTLTVDVCAPTCGPTEVDATALSTTLDTGLSGTNVTLTTTGSPGTVTINALNNLTSPPTAVPISWSTPAQLSLNAAGSISIFTPITGTNAGSTLMLQAGTTPGLGGSISQSAAITVGTLTGSSTGGTFLDFPGVANNIANLGPFTDSSLFGISLTNAQPLTVTGLVNVGNTGSLNLATTGAGSDMTLAAGATAPTVMLTSGGGITQPGGFINASLLEVAAAGPVTLGGPNAVGVLRGSVTGAGNGFLFRNDQHDLTIQSVPGDGNSFAGVTTNGGALEVAVTGTSTTGFNLSIANNPPLGTIVSSSGGPITLMAGGHGGTFTNGGTINSTLAASTSPPSSPGAGDITILADMMTLGSGTITAATAGATANVVLGPVTAANATALGGAGSSGLLGLSQVDLNSISAGQLQIGYGNIDGTASLTGSINIASPISINTNLFPSLLLVTGGSVTQNAGATISALPSTMPPLPPPPLSFGVVAGGSVAMNQANQTAVLAGFGDGGAANSFVYRNDGAPLTIGALPASTIGVAFNAAGIPSSATMTGPATNPLSGVTTNGSAVTVATTGTCVGGCDLTISVSPNGSPSVVSSSGGAITLMAGGPAATFINQGRIDSTAAPPAAAGNIAIVADAVSLAPSPIPGTINAGTTGTALFGPFTAANGISLGTAGSTGVLGLAPADLATVTAGLLQAGYRNVNGTPSVTGNIDIAAPITIDTTKLASLLMVTGGGVSETPGAFINSTAGGPPLALGVIAGGPVSLGQTNQVAVVAGFVDGASNSFLYRNDSAGLTISTLPGSTLGLAFDPATGIPSSANMTGPATNPLAGVTTAGGNILLETTTTGNLALDQPVNAGTGAAGLYSAGTLTQDPAPITASSLAVLSADRVSLGAFGGPNDPNQVGTLAGQVLNAGESFVFRNDAASLTIGTVDVVDSFGARLLNPVTGSPLTSALSGVVTNNANIGLRVTTSGNLNLAANVDAGTASVGLESAGQIQQTGGMATASSLEVSAVGPVSLLAANAVPILAGQTTGAGGSSGFQYRNDAVGLTIGTVPTLLESGTGTPPNNQILSVAGLSGVTTADGSILLETTTSGNLVLNQQVNAGTGSMTLTSAGTISEPAGGSITAAALTGTSVGGTALNQANLLTSLGPFTNAGAGGFSLTDGQMLNVTGAVDASTGGLALTTTSGNLVVGAGLTGGTTVALNSAGTISEPPGGSITTPTLAGTSVGGTALNQTNLLANLNPFTNAGAGGFSLTDGQTLNVTGAVDAGTGGLALTTTSGNLVVGAGLTAGTNVTLTSAGTITEPPGGSITAATLTGSSAGGTALNQPNLLTNLGPFTNTGGGGFSLTDGQTLNVTGVVNAGTSGLALTTTSGNLVVGAGLSAGTTVTLTSAGTITEPPGGLITAATLTGTSAGGTALNQPNLLANLGPFTNLGAGGFALTNAQTLNLIGAVDAGTGGLALTTTSGNLVVGAGLTGGTTVALNSAGTISEPPGGSITMPTLAGTSVGGTALNQANLLASLGPFTNTGAGGFALTDGQTLNVTGAVGAGIGGLALTTTSGNLVVGAGLSAGTTVTLTSAGTITEPAGGSITAAALTGSSAGGASLTQGNLVGTMGPFSNVTSGLLSFTNAQPLTTAGVVSSAGGLMLTTTGAGSNLTVGGGLTASGQTVTLTSGGTITERAGGVITAATLNGSSAGDASLDQGNLLANLGPFTTTVSGTFTFTDNQALTVSGPLNSAGDMRIKVNTGDLTLVGNITAGGGSSNAALVATAGNASELDDPAVTASGLIIDAAGNVSFGVTGGKVFPANANAVGTLAGTAGGSFGFLNGPALTIGTVPATGGVASQSGISASATTAGDVLIQTNNLGQPLTLASNIIASGRAILDTAGGFSQTGAVTVTAPVLAIDTTGSGVGTLLGFIPSTNVNANVIGGLPPAGKTSNPMQFANLSAPNSVVLLFADQGAVTGTIQAGQLGVSGIGSGANLQGSINGVTDPTAALLGVRDPEPAPTYLFNDCVIAAATCFVPTAATPLGFLVVQPQSPSAVTAADLLPDIAATADFITPEAVRALRQSPDPDVPVINIFDEEHLCDETAKGSQPGRERCQEQR